MDKTQYSEAVKCLKQAKELKPRSTEVGSALAQALRGSGEINEGDREAAAVAIALSELARSDQLQDKLSLDLKNCDLRSEIGKIQMKYGDPDRGVAWLRSAVELVPNHREANLALAEYYESLRDKSPSYAKLAKQCRDRIAPAIQ